MALLLIVIILMVGSRFIDLETLSNTVKRNEFSSSKIYPALLPRVFPPSIWGMVLNGLQWSTDGIPGM